MNKLLILAILLSCTQDIGVTKKEINVTEEVVVTTEVIGDLVIIQGQVYEPKLDILWIVDESCSMTKEHEQTVAEALPVVEELTTTTWDGVDWRLGLSSAEPDKELYGWVSYDESDPLLRVAALMSQMGIEYYQNGEEGLDAAIYSLGYHADFHRDEADLLTIFVSDEPDQSTLSPSTYEDLVANHKPYPFEITEVAIIYTEEDQKLYPDCVSGERVGEGYAEVSDQIISFCDPNAQWEVLLEEPRTHLPTIGEVWYLDIPPLYPDDIQVHLDGMLTSDWSYQQDPIAVVLDPLPESNTFVSIAYLIQP